MTSVVCGVIGLHLMAILHKRFCRRNDNVTFAKSGLFATMCRACSIIVRTILIFNNIILMVSLLLTLWLDRDFAYIPAFKGDFYDKNGQTVYLPTLKAIFTIQSTYFEGDIYGRNNQTV